MRLAKNINKGIKLKLYEDNQKGINCVCSDLIAGI